jgi:hypothetical protein
MDLMLNDLFPFPREVYLRFRESEQITGLRNEQIFGFMASNMQTQPTVSRTMKGGNVAACPDLRR